VQKRRGCPAQAVKRQWLDVSPFASTFTRAFVVLFLSQPGSSQQACELIAEVARFALTLD
jgi:hypothetical protein